MAGYFKRLCHKSWLEIVYSLVFDRNLGLLWKIIIEQNGQISFQPSIFYTVFWSEKLSLLWYITLQLAVLEEPCDSSPVEKGLGIPSLQVFKARLDGGLYSLTWWVAGTTEGRERSALWMLNCVSMELGTQKWVKELEAVSQKCVH